MTNPNVSQIKRAQKESLYFREISRLFADISRDDTRLKDVFVNRVGLSSDKSLVTVYFFSQLGKEHFDQTLQILKLYKPSLRKALSAIIDSRYTPDLIFKFDDKFEKETQIQEILEKVKKELKD